MMQCAVEPGEPVSERVNRFYADVRLLPT